MRKVIFVLLAVVLATSLGSLALAFGDKPGGKVIAYYFHGNFRCSTCMNMEKYSKEAIEDNFNDVLVSGKLTFKAVNVEEQGNEHFVSDYQLYTKTLILSFVKEGKEVKSKNLDKIWEYAHNKQRFIDYITEEVGNFLKEAK